MESVATFEVTFRGTAGPVIAEAFDGFDLSTSHGRTTLTGALPDQAVLQGVLERIFSLGLELVDLHVESGRR